MDAARLDSLLSCFPALTILVVGDFFLDKYLIIEPALAEISLETGLEAHQVVAVRCSPGAAGTVTANLRAMDVHVITLGVIGDDGEGFELRRGLQASGADASPLIVRPDRFTPTYTKPLVRGPAGALREINRLDIKNRTPLPAEVEDAVIGRLRELVPHVHAVVVADQVPEPDCGVITGRVREELMALARAHPALVFAVDSRERIGLFRDVILKPNAHEAVRAAGEQGGSHGDDLRRPAPQQTTDVAIAQAVSCGATLYRRAGRPVFLTLGEHGIMAFHEAGPTHVSAVRVAGPIDIVGAGDATMAGIVAALAAGATIPEAAAVGCLAAAVTIQQLGTTGTASRGQIAACFAQSRQSP